MNQDDFQKIIFDQSECQESFNQSNIQLQGESLNQFNNQLQDNYHKYILMMAPDMIEDILVQIILVQREYGRDIEQALNYNLVKMVLSNLNGIELVQAEQTYQYFNFLIRLYSHKKVQKAGEIVGNNGIKKYIEVDLDKIKDQNLVALKVIVSSKDQGWATASYSSSWVTLKLIKAGNDNLDHCQDSENLDEIRIVENYRVEQFKTHAILLSKFENCDEKLTKFFNHIKGGTYDKLAIMMKCQYPGWECQIQQASIEFFSSEKV